MSIDDEIESDAAEVAADVAQSIVQGLAGERLDPVGYEIEFHDLQGAEHQDWAVRRFHLTEGLSQSFQATFDLSNPNAGVDSDELLGSGSTLRITRGPAIERSVHGIVHRVDYLGVTADNLLVRIYVAPAFRLLAGRVDCRIFQDQSVPEILQTVIEAGLAPFERRLEMRGGLGEGEREDSYPRRDYCVQYKESDLDFAARLMEEEGITYFFEHEPDGDAGKELLVLVDQVGEQANAGFPETLIIDPDGAGEVPIIAERPETADTESIRFFDWCRPAQIPRLLARGFNWKVPEPMAPPEGAAQMGEDDGDAGDGQWKAELYVYGERRKIVDKANDDDYDGSDVQEFAEIATRRLELLERDTERGQGRSNVINFSPGYWFALGDHSHDAVNEAREFLLTRVVHSGDCPDVEREDTSVAESMGDRYDNSFECIPLTTKFRPAIVTPKPRIYGPQTATVTGPEGEEIHTDKHGRIKVRFHWDRVSALDDTSSCWVRVAQSWAGPGWGSLFIPRIGMEVVVEFLEGNPDRPLVTGCVYNGRNGVPYPLPDEKTKSTIKTNSSVGGDGFNELRFEDAKDAEQIFLHAQRNYDEVVENDHFTHVGHHQTHDVDGDRTRSVGGSETVTIEGNQTVVVNGAPKDPGTDGECEVTGKSVQIHDTYELNADANFKFTAGEYFELVIGDKSFIKIDPDSIHIKAGKGAEFKLDTDVFGRSKKNSTINMDHEIQAESGGKASLILTADAQIQSSAGSHVLLTGDAEVKADTGAKVVLDANALVEGAKVTVDGGGKVVADSSGVNIKGGLVNIKGSASVGVTSDGIATIKGAMVKLN